MVLPPESIKSGLNTRIIGREILFFPFVTSTNDVAKEKARQNAPEGTVVIAATQTAGKGRLKRTWNSPEGTLAYSVILYPPVSRLPYLIMIASLSVVYAVKAVTGIQAQIKWPNDVLINGKKICGILIENRLKSNTVEYAVIGIGINANLNTVVYPEISATATSLSLETGHEIALLPLVQQLLVEMDKLYLSGLDDTRIFKEWRDNLITLSNTVSATSGDIVIDGIAESVDTDGSLLIRRPDGNLIRVAQGDVTLRKGDPD